MEVVLMANTITRNIIIPRLQAGASGTARDMDSDAQWTIHNQVGDWTIMATTQLTDGRTAVVIEDLTRDDGDIVYVVDGEPILTLSKTLEDTKVPLWAVPRPYHGRSHRTGRCAAQRDSRRRA